MQFTMAAAAMNIDSQRGIAAPQGRHAPYPQLRLRQPVFVCIAGRGGGEEEEERKK